MQFNIRTIEVDGSLDNPVVVVAVLIWAVLLSIVSAGAARAWAHSRAARGIEKRGRGVAAVLVAALLYVATPFTQVVIGHVLYGLHSERQGRPGIASVGFWGGPPVWPAYACALLIGYLALRRERMQEGQRQGHA